MNETTEQTTPAEAQEPTTPALFDETEQTAEPEEQTEQNNDEVQSLTAEDIKIPEGFEYDKTIGESFLGILNEAKISKDTAQKLFDLYQSQNIKMLEALKAAEEEKNKKYLSDIAAEKAEWQKQCQSDKEYGGQNWEAAQAIIDRGCKQLATPEAVKLMQAYNLNFHPEIVRMFYRAGKLTGEDNSQILGNGAGKTIDPAMAIFGESLKDYHKRRGDI
ncbi:MAG: hypothetical protein IJQ47_00905 [Synergistaceae bacterium]|nr:hypothetical protein [Synergistaceae bacterium]